MSFRKILLSGLLILACIFPIQGCNNHFVTASSPNYSIASSSPDYFPLNEGFKTTYQINSKYGSSETITYTVGRDISFRTGIAKEWISNNNGVKDTGYFVYSANSILFYESKKSEPEVILTEPLTIGSSWSRFVTDNNGGNLDDTVTIDVQNKGDSTTGGPQGVSYPISGSEMLVVDKIESVDLGHSGYFSKAVRISNETAGGAKNYYWYAEGVGMIKYVLGATDPSNPVGSVEGVLISYGY